MRGLRPNLEPKLRGDFASLYGPTTSILNLFRVLANRDGRNASLQLRKTLRNIESSRSGRARDLDRGRIGGPIYMWSDSVPANAAPMVRRSRCAPVPPPCLLTAAPLRPAISFRSVSCHGRTIHI